MTNTKPNTSWLKTFSIGFSIISFGITLAIVGYIVLTTKQNQTANQQQVTTSPTISAVSPAPNGVGANWKTYRNKEFGFEFQYPKVFDEYRGCELRDILGDKTLTLGVSISVFVKNAEGTSLEEYVDQNFSSESQFDISRRNIQVDGRNAIQIGSRTEGLGRYSEITYVLEQDKIYMFTYQARPTCLSYEVFSESELSVLQQILSTFKFTQ